MNKRIGRFEVSKLVLDKESEKVIEMMHQLRVLVVRAEMMYHKNAIEYVAICPSFRELTMGEMEPVYKVEVSVTNGETKYSFREVEWEKIPWTSAF